MKNCILIAIAFCIFGCDKKEVTPEIESTVHLAGLVDSRPGGAPNVASYWKNGKYTDLTQGGIHSAVTSMSVDGTSVLIGGSMTTGPNAYAPLYWRDSTATIINGSSFGDPLFVSQNNNLFGVWLNSDWVFAKNGVTQPIVDTAYNFRPTAMAVAGDDIYVAGYSISEQFPPTYVRLHHARYWKNGQLAFSENEISDAVSIFIYHNDIYMAGHRDLPDVTKKIACYWKNGKRVDLNTGSAYGVAKSIFVVDDHVYVAGMLDNRAMYWKDGVPVFLTREDASSGIANSIFVQGEDVHVAGTDGNPAYWKNGQWTKLDNQDNGGQIRFVFVDPL